MDDVPNEWRSEISYDIFSFESKDLLSAIRRNEDIEFPNIEDTPNENLDYEILNGWELEDYFNIVEQYFNQKIGIGFENWSLYHVNANYYCNAINSVPYDISFEYFISLKDSEGFFRREIRVDILPLRQFMQFYYTEARPRIENWKSVDFVIAPVDFVEAIEIAEKNGGTEYREMMEDDCSLYIDFNPGHSTVVENWRITYSNDNQEAKLVVHFINGDLSSIKKFDYPENIGGEE